MFYDESALTEWFDKNFKVKPSWNDAPDWANWLAQDSDGSWTWYEKTPVALYSEQRHGHRWDFQGRKTQTAKVKNWAVNYEKKPKSQQGLVTGNKPSWNDAPEWAVWLAMDGDGQWYWHEVKPEMKDGSWVSAGDSYYVEFQYPWWDTSLEERPTNEVLPGQIWSFAGIEYSIKEVNQKMLFAKNDAGFYWSGKSEDFTKLFKLVQTKN
jgi:hypothetical protein